MNLKRKIKEELYRTLLTENVVCSTETILCECKYSLPSQQGPCDGTRTIYCNGGYNDDCNCCGGEPMNVDPKDPRGQKADQGLTIGEDVVGGGHGRCTSGGSSDGPSCGHCRYPAWHCSDDECECNEGGKIKKPGDLPNKMERRIAESRGYRRYRTRR